MKANKKKREKKLVPEMKLRTSKINGTKFRRACNKITSGSQEVFIPHFFKKHKMCLRNTNNINIKINLGDYDKGETIFYNLKRNSIIPLL